MVKKPQTKPSPAAAEFPGAAGTRQHSDARSELRRRVLDHARKVIADDGIAQLSARRLANEAGCSVGTLYNLFEDIDDIVLHILAATVQAFEAFARQRLDALDSTDPTERLLALADAYVDFVVANETLWQALFQHARPRAGALPDWYQDIEDRQFQMIVDELRPIVAGRDADEQLGTAYALWAAVHGVIWLAQGGRSTRVTLDAARRHIEVVLRAALRGLAADD